MLTNKIFNASALILAIKYSFAYYQILLCLLSNVVLLTIKEVQFKKYIHLTLACSTPTLPIYNKVGREREGGKREKSLVFTN